MDRAPRTALLGTDLLLASRLRAVLSARAVGMVEASRDDHLPAAPLIFVDLNQQSAERVEAIARLRRRNPAALIVGFCDHGQKELMQSAIAAGADQVVANRNLVEAVPRLLGHPAPTGRSR